MWIQPDNIPDGDWQALGAAWDERKAAVYARFTAHVPEMPQNRVDGIMSGLLGLYYRTEEHAQDKADFFIQLRDEFHKGFWIEGQIEALRQDYPALKAATEVRYANDVRTATLADKCMGGVVKAFIDITRAVCTERFGTPYGDVREGLRNGVLEKGAWRSVFEGYAEQYAVYLEQRKQNPQAREPSLYRQ